MILVKYVEDNTDCTTEDFISNPEKYRGHIICWACGEKAWYVKGFKTLKMDRKACFGAHHLEGCDASTVLLVSDDDAEEGEESNSNSSDIRVDLDKASSQSIYVSQDNDKHGDEESTWQSAKKQNAIGNTSGFPLNKSLRQLLTNVCRNHEYAKKDQRITIVADSGRIVVDGTLADSLVNIKDIGPEHTGETKVFWGTINNLNERDGSLWLNYGDYKTEPSILLSRTLKDQMLTNFRLSEVSELDGSDVIIVGNVGISHKGKATIRTGFTKYMSFRRHHVKQKSEAEITQEAS